MRASGLDLTASQDAVRLCQQHERAFLCVLNDVSARDAKSLGENARNTLRTYRIPLARTTVAHRVPYINAMTSGRTGPEKDRAAAKEIDALWAEVQRQPSPPPRQERRHMDNEQVDDFCSLFAGGYGAQQERVEKRKRLEKRSTFTDRQRKRGAVRTAQINFRCSPEFKALAAGLAQHCNASVADVMERALALLANAERYPDALGDKR